MSAAAQADPATATAPLPPPRPLSRRARRRVKTATVLQMEALECGAASLGIVLAHHGRIVPLEELRVDCGVSRDGSKASNILRAARKHGLEARGFKKEPAALREMKPPLILHWNFNHFVVLEGFRAGKVHLNDPATGPRVVSEKELDEAFTGVVLTFEPTAAFRRGGRLPSFLPALRRRLRGAYAGVFFVALAGLALVTTGLVAASFEKIFVDHVLVRGLAHWSKPLMWAMFATGVITFCLTALEQRHLLMLENRLALHGAGRFFWHVLRLPVRFFTQRFAGDIAGRVGINDRIARLLSGDLANTAISLILIVFYAALLFRYDVLLSSIGLATAVFNLVMLKIVARRREVLSQRLAADHGKWVGSTMGALQTVETIKASGAEDDFFSRWAGHQAKVTTASQQLQLSTMLLSAVPGLLMAVNMTIILGLGGHRVMEGQLTIGMLIAFQSLLGSFLGPVNQMVGLGGVVQELKGDLVRLDDVLQAKIDPALEAETVAADPAGPKLSGYVELRDISFGHSPLEAPLIEGFSLTLTPGSRVALVGGSGSGKSTLARVVAGLYEPWSGQILFDGIPRAQIPRETLVQSLAMVDQDICLFEGTIRANLTLWDNSIPDGHIVAAARDASIHEEIAMRPGGYSAKVDEGGRNFSGGQRQRLEIARALVTNPSVLVLDEATSALDPTTEKLVTDNLRQRGCTCLIVAHRLSTIRDCDEIIVLDKGVVVQRGTHQELIGLPGPYRTLIAAEEA
jgi:NHLM bacteriocin system ABC transporter peptidase/ATP-binding protein